MNWALKVCTADGLVCVTKLFILAYLCIINQMCARMNK